MDQEELTRFLAEAHERCAYALGRQGQEILLLGGIRLIENSDYTETILPDGTHVIGSYPRDGACAIY